jgi:16S rRNA (cytidine1402-2'-O)-methyltransferase
MSGKLILVATPIGNLGDISFRAVETLKLADFIAAEDTRVTIKLLNHLGIKKPMVSYFEHNKFFKGEIICSRIEAGETCALLTDAGMPAISDPGEEIVRQCHSKGIDVTVIPGPSAVISAIAVSGLPTGRFTFEGFLSVNKKRRYEHLEQTRNEIRTMVFYEAPHKLISTLKDMLLYYGNRNIALVRELTKLHEQILKTTLKKAVELYSETTAKGEFVIIIEGFQPTQDKVVTLKEAIDIALKYVSLGKSKNEASKISAKETGLKKSDIYKSIM